MAAEFPVRAKVEDKELDKLIAKLRATGKAANLSEKEINDLSDSVKKNSRKSSREINGINSSLGKIGNALPGIAASFGAAFVVDKVLQMNAALQKNVARLESIDKRATVVFGKYKKQVEEIAASTANSLGLSEKQFIASTAAAADLLVPMQFQRKEAAKMSVELIKLSGALAEWTGGQHSSAEVSDILTKALLGEREQLKSLGISIQEFDVSQRLAEKGQQKLTGTALQQAKAVATLELITEKSTDAQTAFAEGADSVTRAQAETDAALEDTADMLTELFAPAVAASTTALRDFVKGLKGVVDATTTVLESDNISFWDKLSALLDTTGVQMAKLAIKQKVVNESTDEQADSIDEVTKTIEKQVPLLEKLSIKLRQLKDDRENALTEEQLAFANKNIELIEAEIKRLRELGTVQKEVVPLRLDTKRTGQEAKELREAIVRNFGDDFLPDMEKINDRLLDDFKRTMDEMEEANRDRLENQKRDQRGYEDAMTEFSQVRQDLANAFMEASIEREREEFGLRRERIDQQREYELSIAGENADAKEAIQKKFDEKDRKLREEQAKREKQLAFFQLAISAGPAIAKTASNLGFPLAIPFIAAVAGLFAIQSGIMKGIKLPKFSKGVFDLDGPGTETSDSILAGLSKHESVVHAKASKKFGWLLQPMIEDKSFSEMDLRNLVDKHIPAQLRGDIMLTHSGNGSDRSYDMLRQIKNSIERKPVSHLNIDENGFNVSVQKGQNWTHLVSKRYSC